MDGPVRPALMLTAAAGCGENPYQGPWRDAAAMAQELVWDERKNAANRARHGLDFAYAELVFEGPLFVKVDDRHRYGEERFLCFGYLDGIAVAVVYTERDDETIRIISFRKATRSEARGLESALFKRHGTASRDDR
jgi:uncharacterized DUF497 family protein